MKKFLLLLAFSLLPFAAQAQTPGAQPEFCVTSPSQTANYNQLCISASSSGGEIAINNFGSATGGLNINPNGGVSIGTNAAPGAGNLAVIGTEFLNPPGPSLQVGLSVTQNVAGSTGFPAGNALNLFFISADNAALPGATAFMQGMQITYTCCSSLSTGGRQAFSSFMNVSGADSTSNLNKNWLGGIYGAAGTVNVGGTNTGGGAAGNLFGNNPYAYLGNGATNWVEVAGEEVNVAVVSGATVGRKSLLHLAYFCPAGCDAVQGVVDASIIISAAAGVTTTAKSTFLISNTDGVFPLGSSSSVMTTAGGGAVTLTAGIDLSGLAGFSNCAFKSTSGYCVNGSAVTFGQGYVATAVAPTVSAGQIGYGSTVVAAGGACPTGTVGGVAVAGCIVVNIAGSAKNVPYF